MLLSYENIYKPLVSFNAIKCILHDWAAIDCCGGVLIMKKEKEVWRVVKDYEELYDGYLWPASAVHLAPPDEQVQQLYNCMYDDRWSETEWYLVAKVGEMYVVRASKYYSEWGLQKDELRWVKHIRLITTLSHHHPFRQNTGHHGQCRNNREDFKGGGRGIA